MALKSRSTKAEWQASWKYSNNQPPIVYSGDNTLSVDDLLVSVSNNPGGQNPFSSVHKTLTGSYGVAIDPNASKKFTKSGPSSFCGWSPFEVTPSIPSDASIWARTNPSRPTVLLPVFLFELRELPDMLRQAGRILLDMRNWRNYIRPESRARDLATANLAIQFGWLPLLGDLLKLATFQESVEKRRKEVDRLFSGKGLKRRIQLGGGSQDLSPVSGFANFGSYKNFSISVSQHSSWSAWAVCNWKPNTPSGLPPSDKALRAYVTGLHPSHILANVWEALPWSWLIDWFSNVGDVIQAGNQTLASPNGGCVCVQITSVASHNSVVNGSDRLTAGTVKLTRNNRSPLGASTLTASFPLLGAGQLSILGSLVYTRALK